ncbi:MAG: hypothetical protein ACM3WT_00445, partial [Bacillota bacterium]
SSMAIPLENVVPVSVEEDVRVAVREALEFAARKTGRSRGEAVLASLAADDEWALGYLAYGLACNLASSLGNLDGNIREAYVLGLQGDDCGSTSFPVVLVLNTTCRTAALESIVARVSGALPRALAAEAGLRPELAAGFMDIQVVEAEDVAMKRGLGAAIHSLWAPALKVWSRDTGDCA